MVLCRLGSLLGIGTCTQTSAVAVGKGYLHIGIGPEKILGIRIDGHKLDVLQAFGDHPIDRVTACAANTDDLDVGLVIEIVSLGNLAHSMLPSLTLRLTLAQTVYANTHLPIGARP